MYGALCGVVVRCLLFAVRVGCVLFVACLCLFVNYRRLPVASVCVFFVIVWFSLLFVVCWLMLADCCLLFAV